MFRKPSFAGGPAPLTDSGLELLNAMLTYDPERRISARDALAHPYFAEDPPPKPVALGPLASANGAGRVRSREAAGAGDDEGRIPSLPSP